MKFWIILLFLSKQIHNFKEKNSSNYLIICIMKQCLAAEPDIKWSYFLNNNESHFGLRSQTLTQKHI